MQVISNRSRTIQALFAVVVWMTAAGVLSAQEGAPAADTKPAARVLGTVRSIQGMTITVISDAGAESVVTVPEQTKILRTAPGQKTLAGATPIPSSELQVGDRVLVRGSAGSDAKTISAVSIIAIRQSDIAQKQQQEREDWQKRGIGGPVKSIDTAAGIITLSITDGAGSKPVLVHVTPSTVVKRYPPDSVKFEDAKAAQLNELLAGDQLRARGVRSPDGGEFMAEEIVSGSFRNIAGTVLSLDASAKTLNITDLSTKKPVTVRISDDSQLRKLPSATAAMIAARLKPRAGEAAARGDALPAHTAPVTIGTTGSPTGAAEQAEGNGRGSRGDMQQLLSRAPAVHLTDLQKGDAVMIVATSGNANTSGTVITLLAGVEPMLQASPTASQGLLSAWNLGGGADTAQ